MNIDQRITMVVLGLTLCIGIALTGILIEEHFN